MFNILKPPTRLLCSSIKFHQQKLSTLSSRQLTIKKSDTSRLQNSRLLHITSYRTKEEPVYQPNSKIETNLNAGRYEHNMNPYAPGVVEIPKNALMKIMIAETLIFSVFGFFDNFIMMVFGDRIDCFFGDYITHPMIAAAFGNWVSDLFGLGTSERFEAYLDKAFPAPPLNAEQMHSKQFHNWKYFGRFAGISLGCLVGALVAYPLIEDAEMYNKSSSDDIDKTEGQKQHERNLEVKAATIHQVSESKVIEDGDKETKSENK